jgi:DNA anti-recombination protein RmuC
MREESLDAQIARLETQMEANHRQNRGDIHRLFNGQHSMLEAFSTGMDRIADKIDKRCSDLDKEIIDLRLKWAKAVGYATAISAFGAVVFEVVKVILEKTITR